MWEVEYTNEFGNWWESLTEAEQVDIAASVGLLEELGPNLRFPHSSGIAGLNTVRFVNSVYNMKGSRIEFYMPFDPRRYAILLIGASKKGDDMWYKKFIPIADKLYDEHLKELKARH